MKIGESLPFLVNEPFIEVDLLTLISIMQTRRNQFMRIVWHSNQNQRLKKTGPGVPYKAKDVRKLYVATVRNSFDYANRVKKILADKGQSQAATGWTPQERTWGGHIKGTPFVVHENTGDDELNRLYANFLVQRWWDFKGHTGYWVDGIKADDNEQAVIKGLEYAKKEAVTELDKARREAHPVNSRLDNITAMLVAGTWYKIKPATEKQIEALATMAQMYGERQHKTAV